MEDQGVYQFGRDVVVKPELLFAGDEKGIGAVTAASNMKVRVNAPYRVVHEGVAYTGGDELEVPNDDERDTWIRSGWVETIPGKGK